MDLTFFGLVPMLFGGAPADSPRALLDSNYQPLVSGRQINIEQHYSANLQGDAAVALVSFETAASAPSSPSR